MDLSNALNLLCTDNYDSFVKAVETEPMLLVTQNKKGYILYQIACILNKRKFVEFMLRKSECFNDITDREISFFI